MDSRAATTAVDLSSADDLALADRMNAGRQHIVTELKKLIIGQDEVIGQILLTLFVGGNSLIVGVPGLAKTLLVATLARVLDLKFTRIQFTPDLMPSDITGTDIIQEDATGKRQMVFAPGPIFSNIVLADEINRTPPKTQSSSRARTRCQKPSSIASCSTLSSTIRPKTRSSTSSARRRRSWSRCSSGR